MQCFLFNKEQSRRDDLESIAYMLIYFLKGTLPWQNVKAKSKKEKYEAIKEIKSYLKMEELAKEIPGKIFFLVLFFKWFWRGVH